MYMSNGLKNDDGSSWYDEGRTVLRSNNASLSPENIGRLQKYISNMYDVLIERLGGLNWDSSINVNKGDVWEHVLAEAFEQCPNKKSKQLFWIAAFFEGLHCCDIDTLETTFKWAKNNAKWAPRKYDQYDVGCILGHYTPGAWDNMTLLVAAYNMQDGDTLAIEHIKQWVESLTVDPISAPFGIEGRCPENIKHNSLLWDKVLIPFFRLEQYSSWPHLLKLEAEFEITDALARLKDMSVVCQDAFLANLILKLAFHTELKEHQKFWKGIAEHCDLLPFRLVVAFSNLNEVSAIDVIKTINPALTAMLKEFNSLDIYNINKALQNDWLKKTVTIPNIDLPEQWYDDTYTIT